MSHLPQVIILNGCHGAGKTALAKALQEKLPQPYLHFSFASLLSGLPTRDLALLQQSDAHLHRHDEIGQLLRAYHYAIPGFVQAGCSLILDHAWCERAEKRELLTELAGYRILLVGVHCALPELLLREQARGDGARAEWELARVHQDMRYDLEINTVGISPEDNANLVYSHIQGGCILNGAIDTLDDLNMLG